MAGGSDKPGGPDLAKRIAASELANGAIVSGHVGDEPVIVVRVGGEIFAVGGKCTHYGGPLGDGLVVDNGVVVDACLETSAPGIFAAGDIARFPYALPGGGSVRIEHWVVAERQGQTAALNMLGRKVPFDQAPFFWSQHYDLPINYVGHAGSSDTTETVGDVAAHDGLVRFRNGRDVTAVASIFRDVESLEAEVALEEAAIPA